MWFYTKPVTVGEHTHYLRYADHQSVTLKRLKLTKENQCLDVKTKAFANEHLSPIEWEKNMFYS